MKNKKLPSRGPAGKQVEVQNFDNMSKAKVDYFLATNCVSEEDACKMMGGVRRGTVRRRQRRMDDRHTMKFTSFERRAIYGS